ncbi:hypothetical protein ACFVUS_26390 [Nocardia sp. NPDC058058]|uniref:hypothetical protein n=1 Tax=Nocardia sp. NPDC058058 TaxID=3346317 RepID=UPI0036DCCA92
MNTRTVLVIGADGVLGGTVAAAYGHAGWQVLRGTRRYRGDPDSVPVDLSRPETIGPALAAADLTINTVADADLRAEQWALEHGHRILNMATVPVNSARRLRIRAAQSTSRGTVLLNAGLAPGVTNLVIADMLARHPESDTVDFVMCLPASGMAGRAGVHFVHENLTTIGHHGVYNKRSPRHDTRTVPLPPPMGNKKCFGFAERDRAWLLDTAGGRTIRTFAYIDRPHLHHLVIALNPLGLLPDVPEMPFRIGRQSISPQPSAEPILHWIATSRRGTQLEARTVECTGGYAHAAQAAVIFGDALTRTSATGCFNPEELCTLRSMNPQLDSAGIKVIDAADRARPLARREFTPRG